MIFWVLILNILVGEYQCVGGISHLDFQHRS